MKNTLIQFVVKALKRWIRPSLLNDPKKILVVSTTAMGDTLWATPAIESLRKSWPDATICVLTSSVGEAVLRHNPWTDRIYVLPEPMLFRCFRLWRTLKREQFQEIVVLHASQRLLLPLCSLLGAPRITGTVGINKKLDKLLTVAVPREGDHEIVRRLKLIETIGAKRCTEHLSFFLQPEERMPKPNKRKVVLHPGSKDSFRRWPVEHFIKLGQALAQEGVEVWITGNKEELTITEPIRSAIPGAILSDPTLSLRQFAALLETFDLLITNDTGPVHLACALDVPVIAIYAPSDPALFGPHKVERALAIARPSTCEPCLKRKCRRPFCFLQIGPEQVILSAKKMLELDLLSVNR